MELTQRAQARRTVRGRGPSAGVDSSHPARSTAGLQATQNGEAMGSPLQNHLPLPPKMPWPKVFWVSLELDRIMSLSHKQ